MGKPAARLGDNTAHGTPLGGIGLGSLNVMIENQPAWRGIPLAAGPGLQVAKKISDVAIKVLETATQVAAAVVPPAGLPAAKLAEETGKATAAASMGGMISGLGAMSDISLCPIPLPIPPHGPGVVIDGSATVLVNNMPLAKMGCTIVEAVGPPNKIVKGAMKVHVA